MNGYVVRLGTAPGIAVVVDPGATVLLADLPPYSLALDGLVQGPELDLDNHRISFDHHGDCLRLATAATCRQVADAVLLGLDPTAYTTYVNDVDADTVLAVALLAYPGWLLTTAPEHAVVRRLVEVVAGRDAHGPAYPVAEPALLEAFRAAVPLPRPRTGTDAETTAGELVTCVAAVAQLVVRLAAPDTAGGGNAEPAAGPATAPSRPSGASFTVTHDGTGWVMAQSDTEEFDVVYAAGYLRAVIWRALANGSTVYTVGRRSDLVDGFPVGPAERPGTILAALAAAEPGWGGGTSVGGAPRHADGSRSRLTPDEVFAVVESVVESLS